MRRQPATDNPQPLLRFLPRRLQIAEQRQLQPFELGQVALEAFDLLAKRLHVLEAAVDRRETHIRDLVEALQLRHHPFTDLARGDFALVDRTQLAHDFAHDAVDRIARDRALLQRALDAGTQLALVERLAAAVALDDRRQLDFDRLERIEALAALLALAPPPDRAAVVRHARVDHAGVFVLAEGAVH